MNTALKIQFKTNILSRRLLILVATTSEAWILATFF